MRNILNIKPVIDVDTMTYFLASFECICVYIQSCVLLPLSYKHKSHPRNSRSFYVFFFLFRSLFTLNCPLLFTELEYSCKMPRYVFFDSTHPPMPNATNSPLALVRPHKHFHSLCVCACKTEIENEQARNAYQQL